MNRLMRHNNVKLLWWMRNIAILGQGVAILVVSQSLEIPLHTAPLWLLLAALTIVNGFTWWRIKEARAFTDTEFFLQLLLDMTALFGLLYYTGGATNPFTSLFILQVIIAAITLSPFYTWVIAGIAVSFYTLLMFWYVEVPYFQHHHGAGDMFSLHIQGMWLSFLLLAGIIAWFVVRMNTTIRRQDALLAEAEKIAAIGTLAASAAHELGSPLTTLAMLAEGCDKDKANQFTEQIKRCKSILSRITAAAGVMRAESGAPMPLDAFLHGIVTRWSAEHADTALEAEIQKSEAPRIVAEYGLEQAVANLLSNAADVSPEFVRLEAAWNAQTLTLRIHDKGEGLSENVRASLGKPGITTKPGGMGMGLFLAKSVITRLEGMLELISAPESGTIAVITLPLRRLAL